MPIYIVGHKPFDPPKHDAYVPIQVGYGEDFTKVRDNTGDNIAEKNKNFCELTALYWIWKNDHDSKYVGIDHYRRYFDFLDAKNKWLYTRNIYPAELDLYTKPGKEFIELGDDEIVLPTPMSCGRRSVYEHYRKYHHIEDMDIAIDIIKKDYPEYSDAVDKALSRHGAYSHNMMIMSKKRFDHYAEWIFHVLFEAEKKIHLTGDPFQDRVFGFLSERLFNVYLEKQQLKVKQIPTIFVDPDLKRVKKRWMYRWFITNKILFPRG